MVVLEFPKRFISDALPYQVSFIFPKKENDNVIYTRILRSFPKRYLKSLNFFFPKKEVAYLFDDEQADEQIVNSKDSKFILNSRKSLGRILNEAILQQQYKDINNIKFGYEMEVDDCGVCVLESNVCSRDSVNSSFDFINDASILKRDIKRQKIDDNYFRVIRCRIDYHKEGVPLLWDIVDRLGFTEMKLIFYSYSLEDGVIIKSDDFLSLSYEKIVEGIDKRILMRKEILKDNY